MVLEKHDADNLLPDLSTDSSSDLDGYSNTSSSNIGSSSSSDASSSPLSSSNSSNSSVGIGDDSEEVVMNHLKIFPSLVEVICWSKS